MGYRNSHPVAVVLVIPVPGLQESTVSLHRGLLAGHSWKNPDLQTFG